MSDTEIPANNLVRPDFGRKSDEDESTTAKESHRRALDFFSCMIELGMVMTTIDATQSGVSVPPQFQAEIQFNLNWSENFGVADFEYDLKGVRGSLSFQGNPFYCEIPWSAVWMIRSHVEDDILPLVEHAPAHLQPMLKQAIEFSVSGEETTPSQEDEMVRDERAEVLQFPFGDEK
jgi:stringent starvation protein B